MIQKPIFLPLKRCYFEAFEQGIKAEEFRPHGQRWNQETCKINRPVTLSLGYSGRRLYGKVGSFRVESNPESLTGWVDCYGNKFSEAACIGIEVDSVSSKSNNEIIISKFFGESIDNPR